MFDFSWTEMAIVAVVALVVIGPKDLPGVLRTAGMWVRRARAVAREFQGSLEQMVREAELDEVREQLKKTAAFDLSDEVARTIDPRGELRASLSDAALTAAPADPTLPAARVHDAVLPAAPSPQSALAVPPPASDESAPADATADAAADPDRKGS